MFDNYKLNLYVPYFSKQTLCTKLNLKSILIQIYIKQDKCKYISLYMNVITTNIILKNHNPYKVNIYLDIMIIK